MKQLLTSFLIFGLVLCYNNSIAQEKVKAKDDKTKIKDGDSKMKSKNMDAVSSMAPAEFADQKYAVVGRKNLDALSRGDIDAFVADFADNAVYLWNSGDSLAGKVAIADYWKKRRSEVIETLTYSNYIFLPLKVNIPQSVEAPGIWLLSWYQVNAKYKTGKTMSQWIHADIHFNSNDKIDRIISYLDRASINAAEK
jgi:hypothetical protein